MGLTRTRQGGTRWNKSSAWDSPPQSAEGDELIRMLSKKRKPPSVVSVVLQNAKSIVKTRETTVGWVCVYTNDYHYTYINEAPWRFTSTSLSIERSGDPPVNQIVVTGLSFVAAACLSRRGRILESSPCSTLQTSAISPPQRRAPIGSFQQGDGGKNPMKSKTPPDILEKNWPKM